MNKLKKCENSLNYKFGKDLLDLSIEHKAIIDEVRCEKNGKEKIAFMIGYEKEPGKRPYIKCKYCEHNYRLLHICEVYNKQLEDLKNG